MKMLEYLKKASLKQKIILVSSLLLVILGIIFGVIFLNKQLDKSIYLERKASLEDLTEASAKVINEEIEAEWKVARIINNLAETYLAKNESITTFITNTASQIKIDEDDIFFLVDSNGMYYSSDNVYGKITDTSYYISKTEEELEYLSTLPHLSKDKTYLILRYRFDTTIESKYEDKTINITYCALMHDLNDLNETVSSLYEGANNTFIYNKEGVMLYKQFGISKLIDGYNIFDKFYKGKIVFNEDPDELIEACVNDETVVYEMEINNEYYYMCSSKIDVSDWSIFFVVQQDFLSQKTGNSFQRVVYTILFISVTLGVLVIGVIMSMIRIRLQDDKEKSQAYINILSDSFETIYQVHYLKNDFEVIRQSGYLLKHYDRDRTFDETLKDYIKNAVYEEDQQKLLFILDKDKVNNLLSKQELYAIEYRDISSGRQKYYELQIHPFNENANEVMIGISNRDEVVRKERKKEETLKNNYAMINGLANEYASLYRVDLDNYRYQIYSFTNQVGIDRKTVEQEVDFFVMLRKVAKLIVHPDDLAKILNYSNPEYIKKVLENKKSDEIIFRQLFNGEWCYFSQYIVKFESNDNSNIVSIGYLNKDIEVRNEKKRQEELELALKMAESSSRAKTVFLNSMSHDIRTPMNAIIGFNNMAKKNSNNPEVLECLNKISLASDHLLSLINDVLDMSRIEAGKIVINENPENIRGIINELVEMTSSDIALKQLNFSLDFDDKITENVYCDKLRLKQILLNILGNAIKYTNNGGSICLKVSLKEIDIPNTNRYIFSVKDTGIGMSESFIETIFDPFTREKTSTISGIQGTGLGLSITKGIIDLMGGRITVQSERNKGSEFIVYLDFKVANVEVDEVSEDANTTYDFTGLTVLLAEDNELNREIATDLLEDVGFKVDCAVNGLEALRKVKNSEAFTYSLVLMDFQMPVMDGIVATKQIRALGDERINSIPIIAMTANAFEEDRNIAFEAGMNEHIAKPIDAKKLYQTIKKVLDEKNK